MTCSIILLDSLGDRLQTHHRWRHWPSSVHIAASHEPFRALDLSPMRLIGKAPKPRETCWRVVDGTSARLVTCAIYDTADGGLELRVGYGAERILRAETVVGMRAARMRAIHWLIAFRAAGSIRCECQS